MATAVKSLRRDRERGTGSTKMADLAQGLASPQSPKSPASLDEMSAAIKTALMPQFEALHEKIDGLKSAFDTLSQRQQEAEERVGRAEEKVETLTAEVEGMRAQLSQHEAKLEDLENRSRRNNLRFLGIPETTLDKDLRGYLEALIQQIVEESTLGGKLHIERVHRVGIKNRDSRPRIVLAKFLHYPQKELILKAARQKGEVVFNNTKLRIAQDYSVALSRKRKEYAPLCEKLIDAGIRFSVQYPARLHVLNEGAHRTFDSASAAEEYVNRLYLHKTAGAETRTS